MITIVIPLDESFKMSIYYTVKSQRGLYILSILWEPLAQPKTPWNLSITFMDRVLYCNFIDRIKQ